jgi:hypothetical protein
LGTALQLYGMHLARAAGANRMLVACLGAPWSAGITPAPSFKTRASLGFSERRADQRRVTQVRS